LSTIENVDEIVVLKEGKIVEKGRHNDLLNQKGEYYDLYKKQTFS
jgi:ABC-type multidrug transport system, ATPase and permease components